MYVNRALAQLVNTACDRLKCHVFILLFNRAQDKHTVQ